MKRIFIGSDTIWQLIFSRIDGLKLNRNSSFKFGHDIDERFSTHFAVTQLHRKIPFNTKNRLYDNRLQQSAKATRHWNNNDWKTMSIVYTPQNIRNEKGTNWGTSILYRVFCDKKNVHKFVRNLEVSSCLFFDKTIIFFLLLEKL